MRALVMMPDGMQQIWEYAMAGDQVTQSSGATADTALDARAARLMGRDPNEARRRGWSPSSDLNAAELFRAAPEGVTLWAVTRIQETAPESAPRWLEAFTWFVLKPATLTRAVVEAWEKHNGR